MSLDATLRYAAERNGIQQDFWDVFGHHHITGPETNRAILTALGFDCSSEEALVGSVAQREEAERSRPLPPVLVIGEDDPLRIPGNFDMEIVTEKGEKHQVHIKNGVADPAVNLPLGYHEARAGNCAMRLIVTPNCAHPPEPGKHAGLGVTLYGLRSERNWGCGDFRDLRDLIDWAVSLLQRGFHRAESAACDSQPAAVQHQSLSAEQHLLP